MPSNRPAVHFTASDGWINDPLAVTWHDGRYHLFFQYVPGSATWSHDCRWGHAVSTDLVHWEELPVALEPGDGDSGVWSGSLVVHEGRPTIFYTSVDLADLDAGRVRTASAVADDWSAWEKGPVVAEPPAGVELVIHRDPVVFRDGDGWSMLLGAGLPGGIATAVRYTSPDLATWTWAGPIAERPSSEREPVWTGEGWECPQILEMGGRHVLLFSVWEPTAIHYAAYAVGTWTEGRFAAESWHRLSHDARYYAASAFRDREGRPCLVHWIRGAEGDGWAGATSVPHLLALEDGCVIARPHPEVVAAVDGVEAAADVVVHGPTLVTVTGVRVAIDEDGRRTVLVERRDGAVLVDGERLPDDGGEVQVLLDGPIAEVWTRAGVTTVPR